MLNAAKCQSDKMRLCDERPKIKTKCLYCNCDTMQKGKNIYTRTVHCDKSLGNFRALATVHYCAAVVYHRNFPGLITEVMLQ